MLWVEAVPGCPSNCKEQKNFLVDFAKNTIPPNSPPH